MAFYLGHDYITALSHSTSTYGIESCKKKISTSTYGIESCKKNIKNARAFTCISHVSNLELMPAQLEQHFKVCILYDVVVRFINI